MRYVLLALLLLTTGFVSAQDGSMMKGDGAGSDGSMMKGDSMMRGDGSMMKAANDVQDASAYDLTGLGTQVTAFTTEAAAQTLARRQTVVYYFAATWCPDCQDTYRDLKLNFKKIPADVTLVFVNYDKSADLKKKYGITTQHSFVVIGPAGEKRKVWSGAATVADIVKTATSK